jgi:hypothetical protein
MNRPRPGTDEGVGEGVAVGDAVEGLAVGRAVRVSFPLLEGVELLPQATTASIARIESSMSLHPRRGSRGSECVLILIFSEVQSLLPMWPGGAGYTAWSKASADTDPRTAFRRTSGPIELGWGAAEFASREQH